jgi:hypothetical protein
MTLLPRRLLAKFLKGELSAEEAEEHGLDTMDVTAPAPIREALEIYNDEEAEFTEEDREDLKEALMVALDGGLGDIARSIVTALTGPLFEALPQPGAPARPVAEAGEPGGPGEEPEEENPRAPVGARRRRTRRRKVSRRKTKSSRR